MIIVINLIFLNLLNESTRLVILGNGLIASLGLIWGPFPVLVMSIVDLFVDSTIYSPTDLIVTFMINFLLGFLPYKLWYSFSNSEKVSSPKLHTVYNLLKFIGIITVNSLLYSLLSAIYYSTTHVVLNYSLHALTLFLNTFVFTFIIGVLTLSIFNINFTVPINKFTINSKYSNIALVIGIITLVPLIIIIFSNIKFNKDISFILFIITIFSFLIFSLREIKYAPVNNESFYSKIIERIILMFLAITIIFVIIIGMVTYGNVIRDMILIGKPFNRPFSFLLNLFIAILATFIPGILILKYIEDKFTTPITLFAKTTQEYIKTGNNKDINYISDYANLIENNTEISEIASSFTFLIEKLEEHISNLQKITAEKERIDAELNIATEIQKSILPKDFLISDKFEINASMIPAREVGGDFYDFYFVDEDKLAIIIGDASGKGVPAAMFTVITKSLIKDQLLLGRSLKDVFESVNNLLCESNKSLMFVTVWAGVIDFNTGELTFVNAGHNAPIISKNNKFEYIKTKHGLVLGAMDDMVYNENSVNLNHGDCIYIYTDGITESHNPEEVLFGEERLLELLNKYDFNIETIISDINNEVEKFVEGREQFDDMYMLVLKYK